jgi:3-methyl-2-oxobutanoate hydroxymethyltransferase
VLEAIPAKVAQALSLKLRIPTIGIGAGPHCDGQVLVSYDLPGLFDSFVPPFVKRYARLGETSERAVTEYVGDVRCGAGGLKPAAS